MADQTAKSRTLDYGLGKDVLDRMKAAGEAEYFDSEGEFYGSQLGKQIGDVGERLYEWGKVKEEKQKQKDLLDVAWENSYDVLGNRGSWASPALYDNFQILEEDFKNQYLTAVDNGDIKQQNKLLRDQEDRSSSLLSWKDIMTQNSEVMGPEGTGYSNALSAENKNILMQLNAQEDPQIQINPATNELEFIIQGLDGNPQVVNLTTVQEIIEKNMPPTKIGADLTLSNKVLEKYGEDGGEWDSEVNGKVMAENKKRLKGVKNIATMFYDDFTDTNTTFAEDIKNHPDLNYYNLSYDTLGIDASVLDADGDGKISGEEQNALTGDDIDKIIEHMLLPENRGIAEEYLAEYMTLKQKAYYNRGFNKHQNSPENKGSGSPTPPPPPPAAIPDEEKAKTKITGEGGLFPEDSFYGGSYTYADFKFNPSNGTWEIIKPGDTNEGWILSSMGENWRPVIKKLNEIRKS
tara:strand:+ start:499 stop:1884 length:1386 start_codon:yes stop_codon:yes gene_type:complete